MLVILKHRILLGVAYLRLQKLIKETVNCSSFEKFRKILNRHFAEPFKTALFRATTKTKVSSSSFRHCFLDGNNIYLVDFHDTHLIDIWLFQNRIPAIWQLWILRSFDLNSFLTRQTSVKVAYKPGLDYLLLRLFSPEYFARIISVLPPPAARTAMVSTTLVITTSHLY